MLVQQVDVGKTKNFLGQQKQFISSISTIPLAKTTIFFLHLRPQNRIQIDQQIELLKPNNF